jgi:hypothetical protein
MSHSAKLASLPRSAARIEPGDILSPELRAFLDGVVVPALVNAYFSENDEPKESEKIVAPSVCASVTCAPSGDRRPK